jgi:hypothetical protein
MDTSERAVPRRVVELRVHGVSGTPPEELLDRPLVRQVAGDRVTGFYRPREAQDARDVPVPDDGRGPHVRAYLEAYTWGGLTSGAPVRALWLLLLPFALLNVAPRLRPAALGPRRLAAVLLLARVLAVLSTMTLVIGAAMIGIDLVGWQCGAGRACGGLPAGVLGLLVAAPPRGRVLAGALLPAVLLVVLWVMSRVTVERYEAVPDSATSNRGPTDELDKKADALDPSLDHPWLWRGTHMVRRLRRLHLQAGVLAIVLVAVLALDTRPGAVVVALLTAGACVALVGALAQPDLTGRRPSARLEPRSARLQRACSVLTLVAASGTALLLVAAPVHAGGTGLPGLDVLVTVGFTVQVAIVGALAALVAPVRDRAAGLRGWGTPLLASVGVLLGAVFTAGMYIYSANWLRTGGTVPSLAAIGTSVAAFAVPWALRFAMACFAGTAIVLAVLVVAGVVVLRTGWKTHVPPDEVEAAYPQAHRTTARDDDIRKVFWKAQVVDRIDAPLRVVIGLTTLAAGVATVGALVRLAPGVAALEAAGKVGWMIALGAYLASGLLVLLVLLGLAVFRVPATRRSVGIIWDLASFWPRAVHPLAPPCYAERTVPDLKTRIRWHACGPGGSDLPQGALVLAAHSQGTVISAAALIQMAPREDGPEILERVGFLSYGCVLRRLYSRYFPTYFSVDTLTDLEEKLDGRAGQPARWTNLWRRSDYLGGPVGNGSGALAGCDVELTDPVYTPPPGDLAPPLPGRHSNYPRDPEFQRRVADLALLLPVSTSSLDPASAPRTVM